MVQTFNKTGQQHQPKTMKYQDVEIASVLFVNSVQQNHLLSTFGKLLRTS